MMAKYVDQPDRDEAPKSDSSLRLILLAQLVALVLIALDWLLQQFGVLPLAVIAHASVIVGAFYSARVVYRYHKQTVIPGLVDLTLRMGRQPNVISPYNVFAYLASVWFLCAIGYGIDTARLLSFTDFHIATMISNLSH